MSEPLTPAPPPARRRLTDISSRAFEHPTDRAALAALRKVPGFDFALRKLIGLIGERSLRYLYLASAVRVNERQLRRVNRLYEECLGALDIPERPELFVAQTPVVNAGAMGVDKPFIVLNSGTVALLSDDELRYVLGHELGHILSDHVLYKTMLALLLRLSLRVAGIPLGSVALFAIIAALTEWDRKSELSCDRAGLLAAQDPQHAFGAILKLAGGSHEGMNLDEFALQAKEYETGGSAIDGAIRILNLLGQRHPFHVLRLAELKRWIDSGSYARILAGDYPRRTDDPKTRIYDEVKNSAQSYAEGVASSEDPFVKAVREIGGNVAEASTKLWDELKKHL